MTIGSWVYSTLNHHFEPCTKCFSVHGPATYTRVEAPKGEFGVFLVSYGSNHQYRSVITVPSFSYFQGLDTM